MSTSSALMKLIGNEVVGGGRKSVLGGITKASTKMAEKEGANIAKKLVVDEISEKTPSAIRVFTKDNPMSLQEAYERTASLRNAHANNMRMLMDSSGRSIYKNMPNDFLDVGKSNPYANKLLNEQYDSAIAREIGEDNASKLGTLLGDYARLGNDDFGGSRRAVSDFLASNDSDAVVNKSRELLEDAGVYRAQNSPDGISWTTKPSVALQYVDESLHPDGTKILEGEIRPNNRVIAPQFTERYQPALAQHEVVGTPSDIQQVGVTKMRGLLEGEGISANDKDVEIALSYMKPKGGGNYGHKGVNGIRGGSSPKVQQSTELIPDVRYDKGLSLTEMAKRINAMKASRESMADGVKRIGSADVAPVDVSTLPDGWKELEKYMDTSNDRLSLAIGKPRSKITKQDLISFLEDYGYDTEGTKDDLWKNALMCIDDMSLDELYEAGGSAGQFLQDRLPFRHNDRLTDATNYYIGNKGRTGRLDAEYSDRLGIGRSNTPMSDRLVNPYSGAGGDYSRGAFGTDPTWATGENGVSTAAHERLHAWQDIDKFDWDEEVVDAIDELRRELQKHYHDEGAIKKYWGNSKTDYYAKDIEQEARMLQSYLDNEGYTNTYRKSSEKGTEWGDEVKPAFDKFFKKLRALSKKGVALPAVAGLVGIGALAGEKDNKKLDNIK